MNKKFPDIIATLLFIPAGLCLGHMFFMPSIHREVFDDAHVWPYFALLFSIVITASVISIVKLSNGKYIFEHFLYLIAASILFVTSGILFIFLEIEHASIGVFINVIATGVTIIAGLSYVNIRTEKHERPMRIGMCHMWKMFGFAGTYTIYLFLFYDINDQAQHNETLREFYQILGYTFIGSSTLFIFLYVVNEALQREGLIYNYRDCLDHDNSIANNYCKLFSRNEVIIERNTTVATSGMWKSAENLLSQQKNIFTTLWTVYMLLPKLHSAIIFHYFLVTMSINAANASGIEIKYIHGITVWLMAVSALIGCVLLRFMRGKIIYLLTSAFAVIAVGLSIYFHYEWTFNGLAVCLWVFFGALAASISIPDIALLEVSKLRYNEGVLAAGNFIEFVPIALIQIYHPDAHVLTKLMWYTEKYFTYHVIAVIVILIVTSLIYILHMPNTYGKSLLQIQNELLKHKNYFAFKSNVGDSNQVPRRISESKNNLVNNTVPGQRERSDTFSTVHSNIYADMHDSDSLPPVANAARNYNVYADFAKTPTIIPRVNLTKTPSHE